MSETSKKRRFNKTIQVRDVALFAIIIFLAVFFSAKSKYFLTFINLMNMLQANAMIGIAASAVTLTLIGSGIDLTIGSTTAATSCLAVSLIVYKNIPWYIACIIALALGCVIGYLNGTIITKGRIPPMVATLGMNGVIRGIGYVFTDAQTVYISNADFTWFGIGRIGAIPVCGVIMVICFAVMYIISKHTRYGRECYATGGNKDAARLAGINTGRLVRTLYTCNGLFAAMAGIVMSGIIAGGLPQAGETYGTDIVTAVVLGGTKIGTGEGNVLRTLLGLLAIGILNNGMTLLTISTYWQMVAKGLLMLFAVIMAENKSVIGKQSLRVVD